MGCVSTRAREVELKNRKFRLEGDHAFRLEFREAAKAPPGCDGCVALDGQRLLGFEFLGRARARGGALIGFLRLGGAGGPLLAFDATLNDAPLPAGNTRLGFGELSAALPLELPCFVAGTRLRTPEGMRAVEEIAPGDRLSTRDRGEVRVLHAVHRQVDPLDEALDPEARPVVVLAHSFAPGIPARDVCLSRRQRIAMCGWRADMMNDYGGVLAPAGCLVDGEEIVHDTGSGLATFVHLVLEGEAILLAEGLPVEGAHADGSSTHGHRTITERELDLLRPSVHAVPLIELVRPARPPLTPWEISAIEREGRHGPWSNALRLMTVPPSAIEREETLLLLPPLSADGFASVERPGEAAVHRWTASHGERRLARQHS